MRKVFLDCGMREGDAIAAFLGDTTVGGGRYARCVGSRPDATEYEFIGFESPDYKHWDRSRCRFYGIRFLGIEKLVWTYDGVVPFTTDGESEACRLFKMSEEDWSVVAASWPATMEVKSIPCMDFATYLLETFSADDYVIVKMDIEGAEYDVLQRLIDTTAIDRVRELYVEYHSWGHKSLRTAIDVYLSNHASIYYRSDWP